MPRVLTQEQKEAAIQTIRFDLEERKFPFFTEEELPFLLEKNLNVVDLAIYDGLMKKARVDSIKLPSGLEKPNNREYWLSLAERFKEKILAGIKAGLYDDIREEIAGLGFMNPKKGGFRILKRGDAR
ncbi:MAG: hypothetical protein Q4A78_12255 [Peptostreptococcaceae bacterium]|nr:hypothetical protein [Peptostreptococcaceae bacterium]